MTMSGPAKDSQVTGVQSNQSFAPPFAVEVTVMGMVANGNAFWFGLANADASHRLTVYGNLNPQNIPYYALGANSNSASKLLDATPSVNVWYTIGIAVDSTGNITVNLQDSTGALELFIAFLLTPSDSTCQGVPSGSSGQAAILRR